MIKNRGYLQGRGSDILSAAPLFYMVQNFKCNRPENKGKDVSDDSAGYIRNQIRDIGRSEIIDQRLQHLDAQAHQKAGKYSPAKLNSPIPG